MPLSYSKWDNVACSDDSDDDTSAETKPPQPLPKARVSTTPKGMTAKAQVEKAESLITLSCASLLSSAWADARSQLRQALALLESAKEAVPEGNRWMLSKSPHGRSVGDANYYLAKASTEQHARSEQLGEAQLFTESASPGDISEALVAANAAAAAYAQHDEEGEESKNVSDALQLAATLAGIQATMAKRCVACQ